MLGRSAWILGLLALWAGAATACPACAGNDDGGALLNVMLGSMIVFPFGVAAVVYRTIRNTDEEDPS